jgi:aquaporin Z
MVRKSVAELLGTAFLVYFAVGVATLSFGFNLVGSSFIAGVVATALAFGLVLLSLAYVLGPISGCHVNPAVTLGVLLSGRIPLAEAVAYWIAQFIGGIVGALVLWGTFSTSPLYSRSKTGLGADGWGAATASTSTWAAPSWSRSS